MGMMSLEKRLSIGVIPQTGDIHCEKLVKGVGEALGKYSADVLLPYSVGSSRKVDVLANINIRPEYKGSGWNFLVNFPGFLVFAPAWNGYIYKVNYNVDVLLTRVTDNKKIASFNLPINLNIRHAAMNRTWTEVSWFEVGAIALVGGVVFTMYDNNVSPLVAEKIKLPIGDYIAQEIIGRINNSGDFAYIIDSPPLRRNVQRALNRGESYHQLRRSVAYANFGKLRFKTEYEQQIWGECSRLITNCIICYNAAILSGFLAHRNSTGDIEDAAQLNNVSPVAWQHINLYGRYEFNKRPEAINITDIIQELSQAPSGQHLTV
jgi:hypothetical protein